MLKGDKDTLSSTMEERNQSPFSPHRFKASLRRVTNNINSIGQSSMIEGLNKRASKIDGWVNQEKSSEVKSFGAQKRGRSSERLNREPVHYLCN